VNSDVHHLTSTLPALQSVTFNPRIFTTYTRLNAQPRTAAASRPRLWPSWPSNQNDGSGFEAEVVPGRCSNLKKF
jgi:hypothetical protein